MSYRRLHPAREPQLTPRLICSHRRRVGQIHRPAPRQHGDAQLISHAFVVGMLMWQASRFSAKQQRISRLVRNLREAARSGGGEGVDVAVEKRKACVEVIVDLNVRKIVIIEP